MLGYSQLQAQTLGIRQMIDKLLAGFEGREDVIPAGWNNHARWHAGHLVVTPQLIVRGLAGEPLAVDERYRTWFGKGSSPRAWGSDPVPPLVQLRAELHTHSAQLFADFADRLATPYAEPYMTSLGVALATPAESLAFSQAHDGIHLGLLLALKRSLS